MKAYIATGGKGKGCLRPITILSLREHVAAIILSLLPQPSGHITVYFVTNTHSPSMCMCTITTNMHTQSQTPIFPFFFPPCLLHPASPFVQTQRKRILSVILYSFGPFFTGTGYGGPGAASAPPRFTIPRHER